MRRVSLFILLSYWANYWRRFRCSWSFDAPIETLVMGFLFQLSMEEHLLSFSACFYHLSTFVAFLMILFGQIGDRSCNFTSFIKEHLEPPHLENFVFDWG